jgi:hypothetical protein
MGTEPERPLLTLSCCETSFDLRIGYLSWTDQTSPPSA